MELYITLVGTIVVVGFSIALAVVILRSVLRINDMVRNQERIIAELQRINGDNPDA